MENKSAVLSLIFGIAAFIPIIGIIFGTLAIVWGIIGTRMEERRNMALAGLIIGVCGIAFNVFLFIFVFIPYLISVSLAAACEAMCASCESGSG